MLPCLSTHRPCASVKERTDHQSTCITWVAQIPLRTANCSQLFAEALVCSFISLITGYPDFLSGMEITLESEYIGKPCI